MSLQQAGWERVLELGFARRPGEPPQRWLVAELMGRHSNLLLLEPDGERRQVVALGRQVRTAQSRLRPIGTGDSYQPPPPLDGAPPSRGESFECWRQRVVLLPLPLERALRSAYQGISPALARQLAPQDWLQQPVTELQPHQWDLLWQQWQAWLEAVEAERFCWQGDAEGLPLLERRRHRAANEPPAAAMAMPINRGLANFYAQRPGRQSLSQQRRQLQQQLERLLRREQQQAGSQQALLDAVPESEALQLQADALLSQFQPSRSCIDTAQKLYRQARRRRRSVAAIEERLGWHGQRLAWLEASLTYLEQADDLEALRGLGRDLEEHQHPGGRRGRPSRRGAGQGREGQPQPLELISPGGLTLQVGRNHRQNEWIVFRQARRGDLWFHAQELPGSHVVLKSSEAPAGDHDLQCAADLAAHFSRGRGNGRVPVVMVPVEELQRIPGAAPGTVRHRGGEVLWGEPQRALSLLQPRQP